MSDASPIYDRRSYTPPEMLAIISRCAALIGVPYHSIVFASSQNVPVMGVKYVSKVERHMRDLGLEDFAVEAGASFETFRRTFDRLWNQREEISRRLRAMNAELRACSEESIRMIQDLLRKDRREVA